MEQKENKLLINQDRSLVELLKAASFDELSAIADVITDNGNGRTMLKETTKNEILKFQKRHSLQQAASLLDYEIRAFGSNTIVNVFRRKPVSYAEVVRDVAKRLGIKGLSIEVKVHEIERQILLALLTKAFKDKKPEEIERMLENDLDAESRENLHKNSRHGSHFLNALKSLSAFSLAKLVSSALTPAVLPIGIIARAPAMLNPIGLAITAAWSTYDLSGPAFRVTIPAIAHISLIRQSLIAQDIKKFQKELEACL